MFLVAFRSIGEDIDAYLIKVDRLAEGINYLTKTKLKSAEKAISQLKVLQTEAGTRLEQEFRLLLEKASRAIDPLTLYNEERNTFEDPPKIDPELMIQLKKLSAFLQESPAFKEETDYSEIFIEVRTVYLRKSFEPLARENVALDRLKKKVWAAFLLFVGKGFERDTFFFSFFWLLKSRITEFYEKGSHPFLFYSASLLVLLNVRSLFFPTSCLSPCLTSLFYYFSGGEEVCGSASNDLNDQGCV